MSVMIIDDSETNLLVMSALLRKINVGEIEMFKDPVAALGRLDADAPNLILVDYMMPVLDGVSLIKQVRSRDHLVDTPIVVVTTADQRQVRVDALEAGATDFISKPIDPAEFKARVRNLLRLAEANAKLRAQAAILAGEVASATETIARREEEVIYRLSRAADSRDADTGRHIVRMARYCVLIAEALGLDADYCRSLRLAVPMHDIGKIGVPDSILSHAGPLSAEERRVIEEHVRIGGAILSSSSSDLIRLASEIALTHHERWDGTGYPKGVAGDAIPLSGRITAVADVFDALTSERPYKPAWTATEARAFLLEQKGGHFDPRCVDAFVSRWDDVVEILTGQLRWREAS